MLSLLDNRLTDVLFAYCNKKVKCKKRYTAGVILFSNTIYIMYKSSPLRKCILQDMSSNTLSKHWTKQIH